MKASVCSLRACTLGRAAAVACCVAACAPGMARGQTLTNYIWTGSASTAFGTATNWTSGSVAPSGGSFNDSRITLGTGTTAPLNELVYSAAQGNTTYNNTGTFNQSGLFVGSFSGAVSGLSASMRITGGSFTSNTERADGLSSQGDGTLTIAGGAYTKTGSNSDFAVKWTGIGTGTLNVQSGSFTAGRLVYGSSGTGGAGVTNLTGGTTTVNQILEVNATSSTLRLNGGTLRSGTNQSNFIAVDQALVGAGGALIDTQGFAVTIAQQLIEDGASTGGGLTKFGSGTLTLSGSNSYAGGTNLNEGVLAYGNVSALGTGTLTFVADATLRSGTVGTLANAIAIDAGRTASLDTAAATATLSGVISGAGGLVKTGTGTLTLSGNSSYSGSTTINVGALVADSNAALGSTAAGTLLQSTGSNAAFLQLANGVTVSETLTIIRGGTSSATPLGNVFLEGLADANAEWAGQVRLGNGGESLASPLTARFGHLGNGVLTVSGQIVDNVNGSASNLTINAQATGVVRISGTNNAYTGGTSLQRGILRLGAGNALPTATILDVFRNSSTGIDATFDLAGFSQTIGGLQSTALTGTSAALIRNTAGTLSTLTVNQAATSTFAGSIRDQVAIVKSGTGTLTLSGSSSYSGSTTLNVGNLVVGANAALGSAAGGTLVQSSASTDARLQLANGVTASETLTMRRGISGGTTLGVVIVEGLADANAEWGGQVRLGNGGETIESSRLGRFGHLGNGTLTVSGQIVDDVDGSPSHLAILAQATGVVRISGTSNTYSGQTVVQRGILRLGATDALPTATILDVNRNGTAGIDATFDLAGFSQTIGRLQSTSFSGTTTARIRNTGGTLSTLTVNQAATSEYAGVILDQVALVKQGAGRLTLSGSNSYTGSTTISGGTLALGAAGSFASSSAIIVGSAGSSGAVLDLTAKTGGFSIGAGQLLGGGGTVQLASSGTLNVLGTFSPGNSPGLFTSDGGTSVLAGTTLMEIFGTSRATSPSHGSGFYDAVDVVNNGTLQFGGTLALEFSSLFDSNTTFDLFVPATGSSLAGNFSGVTVSGGFYTGLSWSQTGGTWKSSNTTAGQSLEFSSATGQLVIVPEPSAVVLAGLGIGLAGWTAARRRRLPS